MGNAPRHSNLEVSSAILLEQLGGWLFHRFPVPQPMNQHVPWYSYAYVCRHQISLCLGLKQMLKKIEELLQHPKNQADLSTPIIVCGDFNSLPYAHKDPRSLTPRCNAWEECPNPSPDRP